jgi:hypothetical protein
VRYVAAASPGGPEAFKLHGILVPREWRGYMWIASERPGGQVYPPRARGD